MIDYFLHIYLYVHNNTSIKLIRQISEGAKSSQRGGQTDPRGDPTIPEVGGQTRPSLARVHRPLRKFVQSSTHLGKEKYMQHGKFWERETQFWIKIKSLYHREIRRRRTPSLQQPIDAVIFYFSPSIANSCWCFLFSRTNFFFPDCFLVLADRTAHGSYRVLLSQDDFPFSQIVFHLFRL